MLFKCVRIRDDRQHVLSIPRWLPSLFSFPKHSDGYHRVRVLGTRHVYGDSEGLAGKLPDGRTAAERVPRYRAGTL
jgi:hypothetical protein